jgi:hypothetical protein
MSDTNSRKIELVEQVHALRDQEKEAENTLCGVRERLLQARTALAEFNCPYKVGQRGREGEARGPRSKRVEPPVVEVARIIPGWGDDEWRLVIRQVKKDGTLGTVERTLWRTFVALEGDA